jgi:hypothetical protein
MNKFRPLFFIVLMFASILALNAQSVSKSKVEDFGTWNKEVSPANKISISSYVTKQKILTYTNEKAITNSAKYRYELVLQSNSIYEGKLTKTWIYGAKVFIDTLEVTREQSPDGFIAIINTEPTIVYRYDTNMDTINIKISWKSSRYYRDK